jgi:hypothetical protein
MSDLDKYLEAFALFIGSTPARYVCRIYMALSISTLSVLPSVSHTGIIQTAVNDLFNSHFSVDPIQTLTNLVAVSLSFVYNVFRMKEFTYRNVLINIRYIVFNIFIDLFLLPFRTIMNYIYK